MTEPHVDLECCGYRMIFFKDFDYYHCQVCGHQKPGFLDYPLHHWSPQLKFGPWTMCPKCKTMRKKNYSTTRKGKYIYKDPLDRTFTNLMPCKHGLWDEDIKKDMEEFQKRYGTD